MNKTRLVSMIEASFFAGFALILDLLPSIQIAPWVSISFAMVPIFVISFRWGTMAGMLSGFLWGVLRLIFEPAMFTPLQVIIDYFIAFAFIGLAGLFRRKLLSGMRDKKRFTAVLWLFLAVFTGSFVRYFWHFIAGIIFWGHYAPEGTSPVIYSFVINGTAMLGSFFLSFITLVLLFWNASKLIFGKERDAFSSPGFENRERRS